MCRNGIANSETVVRTQLMVIFIFYWAFNDYQDELICSVLIFTSREQRIALASVMLERLGEQNKLRPKVVLKSIVNGQFHPSAV